MTSFEIKQELISTGTLFQFFFFLLYELHHNLWPRCKFQNPYGLAVTIIQNGNEIGKKIWKLVWKFANFLFHIFDIDGISLQ